MAVTVPPPRSSAMTELLGPCVAMSRFVAFMVPPPVAWIPRERRFWQFIVMSATSILPP